MFRNIAIGLVLALLVALPATAQDFEKGQAAAKRGDYATALREWRPLAMRKHTRAQYALGNLYHKGRGVPQDYAEAVKWYRKAANRRHVWAQLNLGRMYAKGRGINKNPVLAHMWFSLAAAGGLKHGAKTRNRAAMQLTPAQIVEAERLARAWTAEHTK